MDQIYPKCFVLNRSCTYKKESPGENPAETSEHNEFKDEFRLVFAESILKKFLVADKPLPLARIVVALNIIEKKLMGLGDLLESFGEV